MDLNHRSSAYEADEIPLLYPAIVTRNSKKFRFIFSLSAQLSATARAVAGSYHASVVRITLIPKG